MQISNITPARASAAYLPSYLIPYILLFPADLGFLWPIHGQVERGLYDPTRDL